ncbi:hypothetical protein [Frankia nepalensis]|nr:hypothetical protein [Frankia nepalensis]
MRCRRPLCPAGVQAFLVAANQYVTNAELLAALAEAADDGRPSAS